MKILSFDTSGKSFSAAIVIDGHISGSETLLTGETHAKQIMPAIDRLFSATGIRLSDIDMIAVTRGPGSFTGIRIGLGVAKGIGFAAGIPLAGVSTLDAMAWPLRHSASTVYVLTDARRSEVYFSRYRFRNGKLIEKSAEMAGKPDQVVEIVGDNPVFCGSGAFEYMDRIEAFLGKKIDAVNPDSIINASDIAMIAEYEASWCEITDASKLVPVYLRRSEAEINYDARYAAV